MERQTMTYYIISGHIITIFLSMSHLTVVTFPEKIFDYVGGSLANFKVHELNKSKTLVFETQGKKFTTNFVAFGKKDKYHLNFVYDEKRSARDITLAQGAKCTYFTLLKDTPSYRLFECPRSLFIINKQKKPLKINDLKISKNGYLSKGPPVVIEGIKVYERGILL